MVYDWADKEDLCYRMYIEEKKSLEDIMEHFKSIEGFAPSKRAFQTQFRRWEFPSKQNPAHKNAELVQRIKELWETNTNQRDMLRILNEEDGFDIKERELMRVRAKNRWLLRVPNGMKAAPKPKSFEQDGINQLEQAVLEGQAGLDQESGDTGLGDALNDDDDDDSQLDPEVVKKRQDRMSRLQAESAERWVSRKRRRRTRGWAGLPADPPGPPRFPSETTLDESKTYLSLDNALYRDVRGRFQRICEEEGIIKKTLAGPDRWEAVKARLVQESTHLQKVLWNNEENIDLKKLALDVVCTDVTKRMRTIERRMTIAEAKNSLGINPEESRQLRNSFYAILKEDHFTSKVEAGDVHWKELKAQWIEGSELLREMMSGANTDPSYQKKVKAMEVLCRDVMKRLRDDQTKRDPSLKRKSGTVASLIEADQVAEPMTTSQSPRSQQQMEDKSPDQTHSAAQPYQNGMTNRDSRPESTHDMSSTWPQTPVGQNTDISNMSIKPHQSNDYYPPQQYQNRYDSYSLYPHEVLVQAAARAQAHERSQNHIPPISRDLQIDPTLLLAAANEPLMNQRSLYAETPYTPQSGVPPQFRSHQSSIGVYLRLHPASNIHPQNRSWIAMLTTISMQELRQAACSKFSMTSVGFVEGVVRQPNGGEVLMRIEEDSELEAYLNSADGVRPTFSVQLIQTWKEN